MKMLMIAAALAVSSPAIAADNTNFTGVRTEVTAGVNDITSSPDVNDVVYGAAVGFDVPLGESFVAGLEANTSNILEDERQIGAAVRVGYAFNPNVMAYVKGGYTNYRDVFSRKLDGATVGGGLEFAFGKNVYAKTEYKYSDFSQNVGSHAGLIGLGLRF
jgi:outer membrane immunogenic protein